MSVQDWAICDRCEEYYCEDCSYLYTIHYQFEGARCYWCAEQSRNKILTREIIRENKIKLFLQENSV